MATWLAVASILEMRSTKPQSNRPGTHLLFAKSRIMKEN
jgi:hypothetical protein